MIDLYSPRNEAELAFLKGILKSEGIHYYVRNDHFGTMIQGPRIDLFNTKCIAVDDEQYDSARVLLADFLTVSEDTGEELQQGYSLFDKIRMIFEVVLLGWIMPGSRKRKPEE